MRGLRGPGEGPESWGCRPHPPSLEKVKGSAQVEHRLARRYWGASRRRGEVLGVLEVPGLCKPLPGCRPRGT